MATDQVCTRLLGSSLTDYSINCWKLFYVTRGWLFLLLLLLILMPVPSFGEMIKEGRTLKNKNAAALVFHTFSSTKGHAL